VFLPFEKELTDLPCCHAVYRWGLSHRRRSELHGSLTAVGQQDPCRL